jgi:hypothetical protein
MKERILAKNIDIRLRRGNHSTPNDQFVFGVRPRIFFLLCNDGMSDACELAILIPFRDQGWE